jgi:hypothetical protein
MMARERMKRRGREKEKKNGRENEREGYWRIGK